MNAAEPSVWKGSSGVRVSRVRFEVDRVEDMLRDRSWFALFDSEVCRKTYARLPELGGRRIVVGL
jgi:hypothetical protein